MFDFVLRVLNEQFYVLQHILQMHANLNEFNGTFAARIKSHFPSNIGLIFAIDFMLKNTNKN